MQIFQLNQSSIVFHKTIIEKFVLSPYPIPFPPPKPNNTYIPIKKIYLRADHMDILYNVSKDINLISQNNIRFIYILKNTNKYNSINFSQKNKIDNTILFEKIVIKYAINLVVNMNNIEELKHNLIFISKLSVNYHSKAEKFYLTIANVATYLSIVLSAGTISALSDMLPSYINERIVSASFAFVIVLINGIVLAYSIQQKTNTHAILRMQWIKLLGDIYKVETNEENYKSLKSLESESFTIHGQEPVIVKRWQLSADYLTRINMGLPQHKT